ncbi:MAG: hypothetical protein V1716_02205 [Candidatus Uhrbacteria bacterium]
MLLDLMEMARNAPSAAKQPSILADPQARKLLLAVHEGKVKPFRETPENQDKIRILQILRDGWLIHLFALGNKGRRRYYFISLTEDGKKLVTVIKGAAPR